MVSKRYQEEGETVKNLTVRLPDDLYEELTTYAKEKDLSKNQVIKKAIRLLMKDKEGA